MRPWTVLSPAALPRSWWVTGTVPERSTSSYSTPRRGWNTVGPMAGQARALFAALTAIAWVGQHAKAGTSRVPGEHPRLELLDTGREQGSYRRVRSSSRLAANWESLSFSPAAKGSPEEAQALAPGIETVWVERGTTRAAAMSSRPMHTGVAIRPPSTCNPRTRKRIRGCMTLSRGHRRKNSDWSL